jgi:NitT/TauT family transport system substrate-binding protein
MQRTPHRRPLFPPHRRPPFSPPCRAQSRSESRPQDRRHDHPRSRRGLVAALVTAISIIAAGCGTPSAQTRPAGPEKPDLTVAVVATEAVAGLYIAQDKGFFRKAGLHVTIKTITGATGTLPLLLHGGVDIVGAQISTFIQAQSAGVGQFRLLAPANSLGPRVEAIAVPPRSPITSPAQLKGATIAVNAIGGIDQILAEVSLSAYQIRQSQVHYVAVPFQGMAAALAAHRVDAAYLSEPYLTEIEQQQGVNPLLDPDNGAAQGIPIAAYMATRAWAQHYPRTAAAFARALEQGNRLAQTSLSVLQQAMENQLGIPAAVAVVMATGTFPVGINAVQLQRVADVMQQYGSLKHPFNVRRMLG